MIAPPEIENTVYVDGLNGSDDNDGSSEEAAFRSLKHAMKTTGNKTRLYVMNGEYNNDDFGSGVNNGAIMTIKVNVGCSSSNYILQLQDKSDILLTKYPEHTPVLRFDGAGGIVMLNVRY